MQSTKTPAQNIKCAPPTRSDSVATFLYRRHGSRSCSFHRISCDRSALHSALLRSCHSTPNSATKIQSALHVLLHHRWHICPEQYFEFWDHFWIKQHTQQPADIIWCSCLVIETRAFCAQQFTSEGRFTCHNTSLDSAPRPCIVLLRLYCSLYTQYPYILNVLNIL